MVRRGKAIFSVPCAFYICLLTNDYRICIITSFSIYLISGREIFQKRKELRAFNSSTQDDSWVSFKTTQIAVTSEIGDILPLGTIAECFDPKPDSLPKATHKSTRSTKSYEQYTVNIASEPPAARPSVPQSLMTVQHKKNRAAMEANRAAWGYTKVAILFFFSLLVTWVSIFPVWFSLPFSFRPHTLRHAKLSWLTQFWLPQVPSSANRLYALAHPGRTNVGLAYVAGIVLSLMGFWNSVIYIVTSRAACKTLIVGIFTHGNSHIPKKEVGVIRGSLSNRLSTQRVSWDEDFERLAEEREPV